mgnify:CR=1 FL=1
MSSIRLGPQVQRALSNGSPVVGIESAVVDFGKGYPDALHYYRLLAECLRARGVTPALFYVDTGSIIAGDDDQALKDFLSRQSPRKLGLRDLGSALASKTSGLTTVSAAAFCAHRIGIRFIITGAIGGVHREYDKTLDFSSDITALAKIPVAVICSGAKVILDLPKTLEALETHSIPVMGYQTARFPSYYGLTDLPIEKYADAPAVAQALRAHWSIGLSEGAILAVSPPNPESTEKLELNVSQALKKADDRGVSGKDVTPFLLKEIETNFTGNFQALKQGIFAQIANAAAEIANSYSKTSL